jgi:glycerol-3-phosphate acyltransferase PlsY
MVFVGLALVAAVCYLIGSANSSIIISKVMGTDIRKSGSGNAGATNMLRVHGKKIGALTLLIDVLKGVVSVLICILAAFIMRRYHLGMESWDTLRETALQSPWSEEFWVYSYRFIGGIFVVLGHNFPVFFGFHGGKGVATSAGVVLMLNWPTALITILLTLIVIAVSGYVSLGSVLSPLFYVAAVVIFNLCFTDLPFNYLWFIFALVMGTSVIIRHHANIGRLIHGTESNLRRKEKK